MSPFKLGTSDQVERGRFVLLRTTDPVPEGQTLTGGVASILGEGEHESLGDAFLGIGLIGSVLKKNPEETVLYLLNPADTKKLGLELDPGDGDEC